MHKSTDFVLRGGDAAFANRQKLLFDQLSIVESECNKYERSETGKNDVEMNMEVGKCGRSRATSEDSLKRKKETKRFRGKESIFKRPESLVMRPNFRSIPDYHKNPHKWVKYSLSDVSNEDMTDRSNTQAAMSFLKELRARRSREGPNVHDEEKMDVEPSESRGHTEMMFKSKKRTSQVVFRKPQEVESSMAVIIKMDEKPVFKSSKIVLPEYVVGQRPKKICKQNKPMVKVDRKKELRLDHLEEPDEEGDN